MLPDTRFCIVEEPSPLLMKAADDTFMDDSQDSTLMDTLDDTNMSFDMEASHQGFPEIPTPKPTKKTMEEFTPVPEKSTKKAVKVSVTRRWLTGSVIVLFIVFVLHCLGSSRQVMHKIPMSCLTGCVTCSVMCDHQFQGKNSMKRQISGYIVYSGEIRKIIQQENPECTFGEISRIVGGKWRNLNKEDKEKYEERAKRIAEEQLAKQQEATKAMNDSLQGQWDSSGGKGSPAPSNRPGTPGGMQGQYQGHMVQGQQMAPPPPPPPPPRPPSPMFVSVPPRTQRLLHSEAYLRYIEGLRADKPFISDWDKNLTANAENTSTDPNRLPAHWLAEGPGYHGNTSNALWALRDLMLKDTLNISRTLSFEAL